MLSVSQEVREPKVSSRGSVSSICRRKPTEVGEELVASVHGTQPMLDTPLVELVNWVITTELKSTRKSTD